MWRSAVVALVLVFLTPAALAAALEHRQAVVRSLNDGPMMPQHFEGAGVLVSWPAPWRWQFGRWRLSTRLNVTGDRFRSGAYVGELYTFGPSAVLEWTGLPLGLDIGTAPGAVNDLHVNGRELGGPFQMTTHIGLQLQLTRNFALSYRVQHTSNAETYARNNGLDFYVAGLAARF